MIGLSVHRVQKDHFLTGRPTTASNYWLTLLQTDHYLYMLVNMSIWEIELNVKFMTCVASILEGLEYVIPAKVEQPNSWHFIRMTHLPLSHSLVWDEVLLLAGSVRVRWPLMHNAKPLKTRWAAACEQRVTTSEPRSTFWPAPSMTRVVAVLGWTCRNEKWKSCIYDCPNQSWGSWEGG